MSIKLPLLGAAFFGAASIVTLGLAPGSAQAAPAGSDLTGLKATAGEGSPVQNTHYRRRYGYYYDGYGYEPRRYYGYGPSYRYYYGHRHRYYRHHHHYW